MHEKRKSFDVESPSSKKSRIENDHWNQIETKCFFGDQYRDYPETAIKFYEEALEIYKTIEKGHGALTFSNIKQKADILYNLSTLYREIGDFESLLKSREYIWQSIDHYKYLVKNDTEQDGKHEQELDVCKQESEDLEIEFNDVQNEMLASGNMLEAITLNRVEFDLYDFQRNKAIAQTLTPSVVLRGTSKETTFFGYNFSDLQTPSIRKTPIDVDKLPNKKPSIKFLNQKMIDEINGLIVKIRQIEQELEIPEQNLNLLIGYATTEFLQDTKVKLEKSLDDLKMLKRKEISQCLFEIKTIWKSIQELAQKFSIEKNNLPTPNKLSDLLYLPALKTEKKRLDLELEKMKGYLNITTPHLSL